MKRFKFTLDKLKDYKDQVLSKEKNELAQLRSSQQKAFSEKEELEERLRLSGQEFNEKSSRGMSIMEITVFKGFHNALIDQIRLKEKEIAEFDKKIEKQLGVVVQISKDVNSLEKLRDKQLEEYNFKVQKSEEQFIEEYVSGVAFRRT
ncbi:MAG: flagellar export protein FliJ [Oscillospiraceae bacterium]|nr:flagellar export protein FliJ [Oscillospiraceae bacterium]